MKKKTNIMNKKCILINKKLSKLMLLYIIDVLLLCLYVILISKIFMLFKLKFKKIMYINCLRIYLKTIFILNEIFLNRNNNPISI